MIEEESSDEEMRVYHQIRNDSRRQRDMRNLRREGQKIIDSLLRNENYSRPDSYKLKELKIEADQYQKSVIEAPHDKMIIIKSGPGCGKTTTMTLRIVKFIVKDKVDPMDILCITKSRKGRAEFERKYKEFTGCEVDGLMPRFLTFHSYATQYLRKKTNKILKRENGPLKKIAFIDEKDVNKEILKIKKKYHLHLSEGDLKRMLLESRFYKSQNPYGDLSTEFSLKHQIVYEEYKKLLDSLNCTDRKKHYDFTELLIELNDSLRDTLNDDSVKYLFVDEAQDTNKLMFSIIKNMIPYLKGITAVGDSWQEIYKYSGLSCTDFVSSFSSLSNDCIQRNLPRNFRSVPAIQMGYKAIKSGVPVNSVPEDFEYRIFNWSSSGYFSPKSQFVILNALVPKLLVKKKSVFILFRRGNELSIFKRYARDNRYTWVEDSLVTAEIIHKIKGGEADIVFICNVIEMNIPYYTEFNANPKNDPFNESIEDKIEQEKKLFYVAISRPKLLLVLFTPTNVKDCVSFKSWGVKSTVQSEFVNEMGKCVASVNGLRHFLSFKRTYL